MCYICDNPDKIEDYRQNIAAVKELSQDAGQYAGAYKHLQSLNTSNHNYSCSKTATCSPVHLPLSISKSRRVMFYFFKNVHIPILIPIYDKLKNKYPDIDVAFGYMHHAPQMRAGFAPDELKKLQDFGEQLYSKPQDFAPDLTFIADSVYPWVKGCGKLVHVGHGVLSKGQYYTDTAIARREEQADLVCVPGSYHADIMQRIISKPVVATGMAKLDALFDEHLRQMRSSGNSVCPKTVSLYSICTDFQ